jgi:hypothetical protein
MTTSWRVSKMIKQRAHFHLSELFSEDVMYKRDGDRTFSNH